MKAYWYDPEGKLRQGKVVGVSVETDEDGPECPGGEGEILRFGLGPTKERLRHTARRMELLENQAALQERMDKTEAALAALDESRRGKA